MSLTCYHCKTDMVPVTSRKPDGFLQTKYNCECGKAEPGMPELYGVLPDCTVTLPDGVTAYQPGKGINPSNSIWMPAPADESSSIAPIFKKPNPFMKITEEYVDAVVDENRKLIEEIKLRGAWPNE